MPSLVKGGEMLGMKKLQVRYFRNAMTAWAIVVFTYFCLYWAVPWLTYSMLNVIFLIGTFVYGLWYFTLDGHEHE